MKATKAELAMCKLGVHKPSPTSFTCIRCGAYMLTADLSRHTHTMVSHAHDVLTLENVKKLVEQLSPDPTPRLIMSKRQKEMYESLINLESK